MIRRTIVALLSLIAATSAHSQNYSGYVQSSTPTFQVGGTDGSGRLVVYTDWNTLSTAQPDFFQGTSGSSYNLTFGPDANIYNCGLVNNNAFANFTDSPPASLPFVIVDTAAGQQTASIAYDASPGAVQAAIKSSLTKNWSNPIVAQNGNTYEVTNGVTGARPLLSATISSAVVQGFVAETRAGTSTQPEVQTITIQSTHYLFTIDGSASLPSVVTNNGVLNVLPPTPTGNSTSEVVFMQNATFTNNGFMGIFDNDAFSDSTAPWVLMHFGPNAHFVNNGVVSCCQGPYCYQTIFSSSVENSGIIRTKWGASMEGAGVMNNYFSGGLIQENPDSYGIELYGGFNLTTEKAAAGNWGYIAAATEGVFVAQPYSIFDDYGGPLEPGQMIFSPVNVLFDSNVADYQLDLAYGGSIGTVYDSSGPGTNDTNSGGLGAATTSESAAFGSDIFINLHNRVDTVTVSADGATPPGTLVNFMPILYGDIAGVNNNNANIVTLYFDDITTSQSNAIISAIHAGTRLFDSNATKDTVTAQFTVGGAFYSTQNIGQVILEANQNPNIPTPTATAIGVYSGNLASPQYYPEANLQNPSTLTLTSTSTPLYTGNINIEAGWTLRLGRLTRQPNVNGNSGGPWVGTNDYTASLANCTGIEIDSGSATCTGYSLDGTVQGAQTHPLPGNLVVDNYSTPLVLPPLIGSGNFIQQGESTTTINTNRFKGALYIAHGTLTMANATSMAQVQGVIMSSKDPSRFASSLDISSAAAGKPFTGSSFATGVVFPTLVGTLPVGSFNVNSIGGILPPVIQIGSNNLVIGSGTAQAASVFQGQIEGSGGLEVAPGMALTLGGAIGSGNTYSGSTYVDPDATLLFSTFPLNTTGQALRMCGSGSLFNYGTIQTTSGNPQVGLNGDTTMAVQNAAGAGANHIIAINGNYTQETGGNLLLKLNSSLLASGGTPAAAGIASDYLSVGGTLTLDSDALLTLDDVAPAALAEPATIIIAQAGSGPLGGTSIFTLADSLTPLYEGTIFQIGANSAVINYGTLPGHANQITLTLFPPGLDAWTSNDIGSVGLAGSTTYSSGTYTVKGSGADVYNAPDAFQFATQEMTGTGAIVARVDFVQNTSSWAKAGVMMRNSLDPSAAFADTIITPSEGANFQWRGTGSPNGIQTTGIVAPYWVELVRSATNVFTGYVSADGSNWVQEGSPQTINMGNTIYAGLMVTAHNNSALCTGTFDSVNFLPGPGWACQDIGSPGIPGFTGYSSGVETVYASGTNMYGTFDQFRFVYLPVSGTCEVTARVSSIANTAAKAKAGLIIRENLSPSSAHLYVFETPAEGVIVQDRLGDGEGTTQKAQDSLASAPTWLRVQRVGPQEIIAYDSADGVTWKTLYDEKNLAFSGTGAYIGIAVTGLNASELGVATFDNIEVTP